MPQDFDKSILPNFFIFYFWSKIIMAIVGPMYLELSVLEIGFGSLVTPLGKGSEGRILDLFARGCTTSM